MNALSGRLTRTAAYRKTICRITEAVPYLVARLTGQLEPELKALDEARLQLLRCLIKVIQRLTWRDFELLVDLIFAASGWRRSGTIGGGQKTIDIALELPSTGETAFVQVKSSTTAREFADYQSAMSDRPEARLFFVYHTGSERIDADRADVTVIGPSRLAEMALSAGLCDWIIRRAC